MGKKDNNIELLDLQVIVNKLQKNNLFNDWEAIKDMIINYLNKEWIEKPTSDEILNVCCSIYNNPYNEHAKNLKQVLTLNEGEILLGFAWRNLDKYINNKGE